MTDAELIEDFTRDLLNLHHTGTQAELDLPAMDAFVLIAILQLAHRHPGLSARHKEVTRAVVETIARQIDTEAIREAIRRGWDEDHDQQTGPCENHPPGKVVH